MKKRFLFLILIELHFALWSLFAQDPLQNEQQVVLEERYFEGNASGHKGRELNVHFSKTGRWYWHVIKNPQGLSHETLYYEQEKKQRRELIPQGDPSHEVLIKIYDQNDILREEKRLNEQGQVLEEIYYQEKGLPLLRTQFSYQNSYPLSIEYKDAQKESTVYYHPNYDGKILGISEKTLEERWNQRDFRLDSYSVNHPEKKETQLQVFDTNALLKNNYRLNLSGTLIEEISYRQLEGKPLRYLRHLRQGKQERYQILNKERLVVREDFYDNKEKIESSSWTYNQMGQLRLWRKIRNAEQSMRVYQYDTEKKLSEERHYTNGILKKKILYEGSFDQRVEELYWNQNLLLARLWFEKNKLLRKEHYRLDASAKEEDKNEIKEEDVPQTNEEDRLDENIHETLDERDKTDEPIDEIAQPTNEKPFLMDMP